MPVTDLFSAIRQTLLPLLAGQSVDAEVLQSYEPTRAGLDVGPVIYMHYVGSHNYGFKRRVSVNNGSGLTGYQQQLKEATIQLSARVQYTDGQEPTIRAQDLLDLSIDLLESDQAREALKALGISVYRTPVQRVLYELDDRDLLTAMPSADITLIHSAEITWTVPEITGVAPGLHAI